jgi:SAM-dependent methyltransferase
MDSSSYESMYKVEEKHWWFAARREIFKSQLRRQLADGSTSGIILDVGCGTGGNCTALAGLGPVQGVDFSVEAVNFCAKRGFEATKAAATELPYPDGSIAIVTLLDVLEHIEDDRMALAEAWRVLAPGGHLLITVPAYRFLWSSHDKALHHLRRYRKNELLALVDLADFKPLKCSYFNTLLFPVIAAIRLSERLFSRPRETDDLAMPGPLFNSVLKSVFLLEALLLRAVNLSFGVSLICVARKPDGSRVADGREKRAPSFFS